MKYQVEKISKQIRIEKAIKKILKTLILALLIMLLIINLVMFYQKDIKKSEIPKMGNISVFNIVSQSMEPTINVNDLIIIKNCEQEELKIGDIITFQKNDGTIVTHRILKMSEGIYTTKGDNNEEEDSDPVIYSKVYGKYIFKIKGMGNFVEELQKNNGLISASLIIIIFVILKNSHDKKKEHRKIIREKYDIKKKRDEYNKK